MFRLCRLALVVCSLVANITSNFSNSLANNTTFSVEAGGFCQATLFGAKLFHTCLDQGSRLIRPVRNLEFGRVSLLQWRFGQLEKAPEKLSACSQECLKGKWKNNFSGPEKLFFNLQFGRVSLCSGALGNWKRHLKSLVPAPKNVWREMKKQLFGPRKVVFLICNLEGSPFCSGALGSWKSNMSLALFSKLISRSFPLIANSWNTPREWPR